MSWLQRFEEEQLLRGAVASVALSHEEDCKCLTCRAASGDEDAFAAVCRAASARDGA